MRRSSLFIGLGILAGVTASFAQTTEEPTAPTPPTPPGSVTIPDLPPLPALPPMGTHDRTVVIRLGGSCSFLGVYPENISQDDQQKLGLASTQGVVLIDVVKGSEADKAGLKKSDVIVGFNGTNVNGEQQLRELIRKTPVGQTVNLQVMRSGATTAVTAKMGAFAEGCGCTTVERTELDDTTLERTMRDAERQMKDARREIEELRIQLGNSNGGVRFREQMTIVEKGRVGVMLQNVTPQLGKFFGTEGGALISEVQENQPGAKAGLQAGDVIIAVDGKKVSKPNDVMRLIGRKEGKVEFRIVRDRQEQTITVDLPSRSNRTPRETPATPEPPKSDNAPDLGSLYFNNGPLLGDMLQRVEETEFRTLFNSAMGASSEAMREFELKMQSMPNFYGAMPQVRITDLEKEAM